MSCQTDPNNNWDLAILTAVVLLLISFWLYKFLFIINPIDILTLNDTSDL